jgi:DNA-binding transcriptional LysR family regulator
VLGTALVERTTRHLSLTDAGRLYHERAKEILEEVAESERSLTAQTGVASGRLCVSAPSLVGRMRLSPMLPAFLAEQPHVSIDLILVDRSICLAEEGIDVALRIGPLEDSLLIVRKLDDIQLVVCAAPDYLRPHVEPETPDAPRLSRLQRRTRRGRMELPGTRQHDELCAFRRGSTPMTSMCWSVPPWQESGLSECHPGGLPVFLLMVGCGLC